MKYWVQAFLFATLGAAFTWSATVFGYDNVYPVVAAFTGGTMESPICMNDQALQFDSACDQEYIIGDSGFLDFYSGDTSIMALTSTTASFRKFINIEAARLSFNSGQYGEFRSTITEGTHICTNDNAFQTNNWALIPQAACGNSYSLPAMPNPTMWFMSNAGSGSPLQRAYATHDGGSLVIDSHTGPVTTNAGEGGNATTLTASATIDSTYQIVYLDATSADVVATLPDASGCPGGVGGGGPKYRIKRLDASTDYAASLASADNIDGATEQVLSQYDSRLVHCYNSTYHIH